MKQLSYEFDVLVNGKPVKEYAHEGKVFIEGKEGSSFSLRMKNNSGSRALFVPTVDGLSIMDGKEASFDSRGYIVDAYSSVTIDGWRTSDSEVAQFFFSTPGKSYAASKGKKGSMGAIGCAVFQERERVHIVEKIVEKHIPYDPFPYPHWKHPYWYGGTSGGIVSFSSSLMNTETVSMKLDSYQTEGTSAKAFAASADLGTGWGEQKKSEVVTVNFDRPESPVRVFEIFYRTREALEEMGVAFKTPVYVSFPQEENGYCEPPRF